MGKFQKVVPVDAIRGSEVHDHSGATVGRLEEVLLDLETGAIAYAVLALDPPIGSEDRHYPVPWSALRLDQAEDQIILGVDEERLKEAPHFDRDDAPEFTDRSWGAEVHAFYGYDPYWQFDRPQPGG